MIGFGLLPKSLDALRNKKFHPRWRWGADVVFFEEVEEGFDSVRLSGVEGQDLVVVVVHAA